MVTKLCTRRFQFSLRESDGTLRHFYGGRPWLADDSKERGIDELSPIWNVLDLTPQGRGKLRVFEGELEKLDLSIGNEFCGPLPPEILGKRVVSPVVADDVIRVGVIDLQSKEVTAQLFLASANQVSTRLTESTLTVADNLGRVIVIDLLRNCSIRNFRV